MRNRIRKVKALFFCSANRNRKLIKIKHISLAQWVSCNYTGGTLKMHDRSGREEGETESERERERGRRKRERDAQ